MFSRTARMVALLLSVGSFGLAQDVAPHQQAAVDALVRRVVMELPLHVEAVEWGGVGLMETA